MPSTGWMRRRCGSTESMCRSPVPPIWRSWPCRSPIGWWTRSRRSSENGAFAMATNILMPALSPTMTEGTLARWLKKEGDTIKAGDVIAEIETDKATMEVEAVDEGVLGKILIADGSPNVAVNAPIAILVDEGEAVPSSAAPAPAPPGPPAAEPAAPAPQAAAPAPAPAGNGHDATGERIFVSPLARRMAQQAGIDLRGLKGSGPNGRIIRADIEAAQQGGGAVHAPAPAAAAVSAPAPAVAAPPA